MKIKCLGWDVLTFKLLLLLCCTVCANATTPLWLLFVDSSCDGEGFESSSVLPAAEMAVERVNSNSSLLQEYSLNLTITQPKPPSTTDLEPLLEGLLRPPEKLAVLYPGCSEETRVVVNVADSMLFNVTVVTYTFSTLEVESLKSPHHFHMVPSEMHLANGITTLIQYFEWKQVIIIRQESPVYLAIADQLMTQLVQRNVIIEIALLRNPTEAAQVLNFTVERLKSRIFVPIMDPTFARILLCEAQKQNMTYPGYVWITQGWYSDQWWTEEDTNCTRKEMESFLNGTIGVSHFPTAFNENQTTNSGITALEFADDYRVRTNQSLVPDYAYYVFDAVWATAMALNSASEVNNTGEVRRAFGNLEFTGVSGPVSLKTGGIRSQDRLNVLQYRRCAECVLVREKVALIDDQQNFSFLDGESNTSLWSRGVPLDGSPIPMVNFPRLSLTIICYIYATAGIIVAIGCSVFNFVFRNRKLIRLTSPNLNYIIITGAIFLYLSTYFFLYPRVSIGVLVAFCNARFWLVTIGSSLLFGTVNVKMLRVYLICQHPHLKLTNRKWLLKDWHLMLIVLIMVMVDLIIISTVTAVDTARYTVINVRDGENAPSVNEEGFDVNYNVLVCSSPARFVFLGIIYGYKIVLQVIAIILAFSIRKVKIKGLNDSREISAIVYATSIILVLVIVMTLALRNFINVSGTINGLGFSTASTVALGFIFIPKIVGLYRDPHGKNVFEDPPTYKTDSETDKAIATLQRKVTQLERRLTETMLNASTNETVNSSYVGNSETKVAVNATFHENHEETKDAVNATVHENHEETKVAVNATVHENHEETKVAVNATVHENHEETKVAVNGTVHENHKETKVAVNGTVHENHGETKVAVNGTVHENHRP